MHSALQRAAWVLRSHTGPAWTCAARNIWNAAEADAVRAPPLVAAAAIDVLPARTKYGRDTAASPHAAVQRGSPAVSSRQATCQRPMLDGISPFGLTVREGFALQRCDLAQSSVQPRSFATRPHSVAGRRVAAAQQRARSRPPPPAAHAAAAGAVAPAAREGDGAAAPPQQTQVPGDEVAPGSTDAVQPVPASLHEVRGCNVCGHLTRALLRGKIYGL